MDGLMVLSRFSLTLLTDCILRTILITLKLYGKGVQCGEDSIRCISMLMKTKYIERKPEQKRTKESKIEDKS